jgi:hypothetical protein
MDMPRAPLAVVLIGIVVFGVGTRASRALIGLKRLQPPVGPVLTEETPATAPATRPGDAANAAVNAALDRPLARLSAANAPLEQVLADFAKAAGVPVTVEWKRLEAAKISRSTPVSVELAAVRARQALTGVLQSVGAEAADLRFLVMDGGVIVSTADDLASSKYQEVRVYNVGSLFADVEPDGDEARQIASDFLATLTATLEPDTWRDNGGVIGSARIMNGYLIVNQTVDRQEKVAEFVTMYRGLVRATTRAYYVGDLLEATPPAPAGGEGAGSTKRDELLAVIQSACGRDTWRGQGGRTSSAAYFNNKLYVTTTPAVHEQVERLLGVMRKN